jgi:hypothetical protein
MSIQVAIDPRDTVEVVAIDEVETIVVGDVGPPGPPGPQGPPGRDGTGGVTTAVELPLIPGGTVSAINVQDAILELDAEKVARAGDTMSGHLGLPPGPSSTQAARRDYVDAADALRVAKAGDTMTGHLTLPTGPSNAHAVRKDYVDTADATKADVSYVDTKDMLKVTKAGDIMTGVLDITMSTPNIRLNKTAGTAALITGRLGALPRWQIVLGDTTAEGGGNSGSNFQIKRFDDAGTELIPANPPFSIARNTGQVNINTNLAINNVSAFVDMYKLGTTGNFAGLRSFVGSTQRWQLEIGNTTAEGGANSGSDFSIHRYADNGAYIDSPLLIRRSTGLITGPGDGLKFGTPILASSDFYCCGATFAASPGVGNTSTGAAFANSGGAFLAVSRSAGFGAVAFINVNAAGTNTQWHCAGVTVGSVSVTGSATAYNTSSDARLKEDLKSFDAGNIVDDTNVYDFKWKETGTRDFGVISQEAKDVYPAAVFHDEATDWWGIDYSKYVPVILQELKALRERVAILESQLAAKPA